MKKQAILFLAGIGILLVLIIGFVLMQQKTDRSSNQNFQEQIPQQLIDNDTRTDGTGIQTTVDLDVDHWQEAERRGFFSIRFPKEWYWRTSDPNSGYRTNILTNDPGFEISKYPDLGLGESGLVIENNRAFVIMFYGSPTVEIDNPEKSTENIINGSFSEKSEWVKKSYNAVCGTLAKKSRVESVLLCTYAKNNQVFRKYFIANRRITVSLTVQMQPDNIVSTDIFDTIANNIRLLK